MLIISNLDSIARLNLSQKTVKILSMALLTEKFLQQIETDFRGIGRRIAQHIAHFRGFEIHADKQARMEFVSA